MPAAGSAQRAALPARLALPARYKSLHSYRNSPLHASIIRPRRSGPQHTNHNRYLGATPAALAAPPGPRRPPQMDLHACGRLRGRSSGLSARLAAAPAALLLLLLAAGAAPAAAGDYSGWSTGRATFYGDAARRAAAAAHLGVRAQCASAPNRTDCWPPMLHAPHATAAGNGDGYSIHQGSCGFGGNTNGNLVAALSDQAPDYAGVCAQHCAAPALLRWCCGVRAGASTHVFGRAAACTCACFRPCNPPAGATGSCGRCYEVACRPSRVSDGYGNSMDRSDTCNGGGSVVVMVTGAPLRPRLDAHTAVASRAAA